jgi:hypothetical protein
MSMLFPWLLTRFYIKKLEITIDTYWYTWAAASKPRYFASNLFKAESNVKVYGLSNYGKPTVTGTQNIVYWYMTLTKYRNIKKDKNFKNK